MNEGVPKSTSELPEISSEKLEKFISNTGLVIQQNLDIALRGMEVDTNIYEPWPVAELKKSCDSIIVFFEQREKLYNRTHEEDLAQKAKADTDAVKSLFAELDDKDSVPEDFLERMKDVVSKLI